MPSGELSLVDVQFVETPFFPKLDLKLRNTGPVAVLKKAAFNVEHVWELHESSRPALLQASWNYDVQLPVLGAPYVKEIPLSQSIKNGESDRFTFTVANDAPPALRDYAFLLTVDLIYNENNRKLSTGPLLFVSRPAGYELARTGPTDFAHFKQTFARNLQIVERIRAFPATRSPRATDYLSEYSEAAIPKLIEQLGNTAVGIRLSAAGKLGCFGGLARAALPTLQEIATSDSDQQVRAVARTALEEIRLSRRAPELPDIDRDEFVRRKIMWQNRPPGWVPPPTEE